MATKRMNPRMMAALAAAQQAPQAGPGGPPPGPSMPPPGAGGPPGMKKGGGVKKMAKGGVTKGDGIAQSGKTRGTQIKMKSGGRC